MVATKTNERPGTRAQVKYVRVSAYKAREVLKAAPRGREILAESGIEITQAADMADAAAKVVAASRR